MGALAIHHSVYFTCGNDVSSPVGSACVGTYGIHGIVACILDTFSLVFRQSVSHRNPDVWEKDYLERVVEMV